MDTKCLILPRYQETGSYAIQEETGFKVTENYLNFFKYMAIMGWSEYKTTGFLNKTIEKYAKIYRDEMVKFYRSINYSHYDEAAFDAFYCKFKGNIFEIISEAYFRYAQCQNLPGYSFDHWTGMNQSEDDGVDGYLHSNSNPKLLIAIQSKERAYDQIKKHIVYHKANSVIRDEMEEKLLQGKITDCEYLDWSKKCDKKVVIITDSTVDKHLIEKYGNKMAIIDNKTLLDNLGANRALGNKQFWDKILADLIEKSN
jgi:hypothetical protein